MSGVSAKELDQLALRLVATDRRTASATVHAIRTWARSKKATGRTYAALRWADAIDRALNETAVRA